MNYVKEKTDIRKNNEHQNELYPIFLKLDQFETLLVGGGNVALEKLQSLLGNSPNSSVTVVAPLVRKEVADFLSFYPKCRIIQRAFEVQDLDHKRIVICATDDKELHVRIKFLANQKGILVNVADTPELCDFYLSSIVQKGSLKIAVSTNGKSPTVAKRLKEAIDDMIPDQMEDVLDNLQAIRNKMKGSFQEKVKRLNDITKELVNESSKR
jgi:siroheme synthase-like protein